MNLSCRNFPVKKEELDFAEQAATVGFAHKMIQHKPAEEDVVRDAQVYEKLWKCYLH